MRGEARGAHSKRRRGRRAFRAAMGPARIPISDGAGIHSKRRRGRRAFQSAMGPARIPPPWGISAQAPLLISVVCLARKHESSELGNNYGFIPLGAAPKAPPPRNSVQGTRFIFIRAACEFVEALAVSCEQRTSSRASQPCRMYRATRILGVPRKDPTLRDFRILKMSSTSSISGPNSGQISGPGSGPKSDQCRDQFRVPKHDNSGTRFGVHLGTHPGSVLGTMFGVHSGSVWGPASGPVPVQIPGPVSGSVPGSGIMKPDPNSK